MARKMKDSGIEWIGEIPEGWDLRKGKILYRVATGKLDANAETPDGIYPFFTCSMTPKRINSYSFDCEALLVAGNGLVGFTQYYKGKFDAYQRTYILSGFHNVSPSFLRHYVSVCLPLEVQPKSIGSVIQFIKLGDLLNFNIVLPSIEQQNTISNYLESRLFQINTILSKTRSSIEEYKKLKQAVITQAVTKGVRGEREMKDSGTPWFGQIPTDWKLSRVGLHFAIILGKMLCNAPLNDTYTLEPYYCAADVHFDGVADGERKKMWFSPIEKDLYRVSVGDLLVVEGGAGAGGSAIVENQDSDTYIQNSIMIVRSKGNTDNRYLRYLLEFLVKQGYIDIVCNKATIPHFTKDKLSCVPFCLCPTGEQEEIADYLDAKCTEIDKLIAKKEQLVKELEGYKKSLIYEVVTGKREV